MKKKIALFLVFAMMVSMLAACTKQDNSASYDASAVKTYIKNMYQKTDGKETASDYDLVGGKMAFDGAEYDVVWTVNVTKGNKDDVKVVSSDKKATIDVNEKASEACEYTLTVTITAPDKTTDTWSLTHVIPAYKQFSWADYVAAAAGDSVVCQGVVTGIISKTNGAGSNCIYFQDKDGGYYAYQTSVDPVADLGLKIGNTIAVTGAKDIYSGTHEIKSGVVEVVSTDVTAVTPVDYTAIYKAAADLKDATLVEKQALLVTIKGVEIVGQGSDATYFNFKLDGKESYIRLSSSTCPLTKDEQATFSSLFLGNIGNTCDVTGLITLYSGAFYLTPVSVDAVSNIQKVEKTPAEMVAFEAENLGIPTKVQEDKTITLAATGSLYSDVAITYVVEGATPEDGKLALVQGDNDAVVKVTATLTCGTETKEVVVEIKVEAKATDMPESVVVDKAFALAENEVLAGTQVLSGTITEIVTEYSEQYGNITFNMEVAGGKVIQVFRCVGGQELKVGDKVVVTGTIKNYKGTVEFDAKCTYSTSLSVEEAKQLIVLDKAFALAENESLAGTQVLTGTIADITTAYSEQYGNITFTMTVGDKTITAFRCVGGQELKAGDVVTVTGTIKNYKGTVEFDAKCTYAMGSDLELAKDLVVMDKAYALEENTTLAGVQEVKGTITEIVTEYSEQYNNVTFNMQVGDKTIQVFRCVGGQELKVGDVVTITGTIKNYKGTVEFDAKCTYTK